MTDDVKVFAKTIEPEAREQVNALAANRASDNSKIRIMPDVHAGAGCTIGTTMTISDRVCPNLVGVDIGCGMLALKLGVRSIDFDKLDNTIKWEIPFGFRINRSGTEYFRDLVDLRCKKADLSRARCSLGTLGGGNHFIEVDRDKSGILWLVIHSGSRHLGLEVASWYQDVAWDLTSKPSSEEREKVIKSLMDSGRKTEIAQALKDLSAKYKDCGTKDLAYLTGAQMEDYLHDMNIVQAYAARNREIMAEKIIKALKLKPADAFTTKHNYIDLDRMILRKGAVSANAGEKFIIPMNMRDGSLICTGKGNEDWNFSAPHGAGRLMSRKKAKESISLMDYVASMGGIHSMSVSPETIDESPFAYKDMKEIIGCIDPTCKVVEVIKPVYNFKASN